MEVNGQSYQVCLVIVNTAFLLAGLVGVVAGVLVQMDPTLVQNALAENNVRLTSATPSSGVVISMASFFCFLVSFLGCVGAFCKITVFLVLYCFCLSVILVAELTSAIFISASPANSSTYVAQSVAALLRGYNESVDAEHKIKSSARILFSVFACCGVLGPSDFNGTLFPWEKDPNLRRPNTSSNFPLACCINVTVRADVTPAPTNVSRGGRFSACFGNITSDTAFLRGCLPVIEELINFYSDHIIIIGIGSALLEIVLIAFSTRQYLYVRRKLIYDRTNITKPFLPTSAHTKLCTHAFFASQPKLATSIEDPKPPVQTTSFDVLEELDTNSSLGEASSDSSPSEVAQPTLLNSPRASASADNNISESSSSSSSSFGKSF